MLNGSHNQHAYPANKLIPKYQMKRLRMDIHGKRIKNKHNSSADSFTKHHHIKKVRAYYKEEIRRRLHE